MVSYLNDVRKLFVLISDDAKVLRDSEKILKNQGF